MADSEYHLSFIRLAPDANHDRSETVCIGPMHMGGGCQFEFLMRWSMLSGSPVAKLEVFDDSFLMFADPRFEKFRAWLASMHKKNPSPKQAMDAMRGMGFEDLSREHWKQCNRKWEEPE